MNHEIYLKCDCKECGNHIEFPPSIERTTISCPHCGQWTELIAPEMKPTSGNGMKRIGLIASIGCVVLLLIALVGVVFWMQHRRPTTMNPSEAKTITKPTVKVAATPTNSSPLEISQPVKQPPTKPKEKSLEDLKTGEVTLEKTKGSSLVYAVGNLKNDSEFQRFGVKIEFDLYNSKGKKIAATQDYKGILEPHQNWNFRALIPDPKAVQAKVSSIKED